MASPVSPERAWRPSLGRTLGYLLAGAGVAAFSLLLLQLLLGRRLAQQQLVQTGSEVAANVVLGEVALERFSPEVLGRFSGMQLVVGQLPEPAAGPGRGGDRRLRWQTQRLQAELCRRLGRCPAVRPAAPPRRGVWVEMASPLEPVWLFVSLPSPRGWPPDPLLLTLSIGLGVLGGLRPPPPPPRRGVWVEMASPLEPVWLFVSLPSPRGWPPDPLLLTLSIGLGVLGGLLLFLTLEIQRPLTRLQEALADVGLETLPAALPDQGAAAVRQLVARFNAMLLRLEDSGRERTTMLAGIAHDLRSPLTRLRLRLALAAEGPMAPQELERAQADIRSIERITRQFMIFAGAEAGETPVLVPLDALVAEAAAAVGEVPLELDLEPLVRRVRPTALVRAVGNLLDNALTYGRPPLRVVLRPLGPGEGEGRPHGEAATVESGFEVQVWDCGEGIDPLQWHKAMTPFQRLDRARGGEGHCGLGLAIAAKVARDHGGDLRRLEASAAAELPPGRFAVALRAWPLAGG